MNNAAPRQKICERCILVKCFNNEIQFPKVQQVFPESVRGCVVSRTATYQPRDKEWIVEFRNHQDAQRYIQIRVLKHIEGLLEISACNLPGDVPEEWLQNQSNSGPQLTQPVPAYGQPPAYSSIDSQLGDQHGLSYPANDPTLYRVDPRQFSNQYMQFPPPGQHFYPNQPYGGPPPQFYPGSAGKSDPSQDPGKGTPLPDQWAWQQNPYGPYSGYGYGHFPGYDPQNPTQPRVPPGDPSFQPTTQPQGAYPGYQYHTQPTASWSNTPPKAPVVDQRSTNVTHGEDLVISDVTSPDDQDEEDKTLDEQPTTTTTTNMLKVTKLPKGTSEDTLRFFFENTRKSGGGDVKDVDLDDKTDSAIVTFEEDEAVDIVLNKMPIMLNKKVIEVAAYRVDDEKTKMDITSDDNDDGAATEPDSYTIEVSRMKESTSQDTIMFYFESKKGANSDVTSIDFDEDKNIYLVTFEDAEAVDTALSKDHVIDGTKLHVQKHIPPKRYPDKALVKGLNTKTTKDGITNFMEARTKTDVEEVEFGDENSGNAIVTFSQPIDIGKIQSACKEKPLDKSYLTVQPVFVTNCVVVRGYSDKTSESDLEYYFDNKKRSGVEGVTSVTMNNDEDYCVIYFEDPKDALKACQKKQTIHGQELKVLVFYDSLGVPGDSEGPKFKPLSPMVTAINKYMLDFLNQSESSKERLEEQVKKKYGHMTWPESTNENNITVDCTLTKDIEGCRKLAKTWEEDIKNQIDDFVNHLKIEEHPIIKDQWSSVMDGVRQISIDNPQAVMVRLEKLPACKIIVVGQDIHVKDVSDNLRKIVEDVSREQDRNKQMVQDEVTLKHHQLLVLAFSHFSDTISQKFEKMEVKINTKQLVLKFYGLPQNINAAKIIMFETLGKIAEASIGKKSSGYITFLKKPEVKSLVSGKIKNSGSIGVWDIHDNCITMYSMSDEEAVHVANILKDCVIETKVDVDNLQISVLRTTKWKNQVEALKGEFDKKSVILDIVTDNHGQIILYCTSKGETGLIREKIQDFFMSNTEKEITISLGNAELKFLHEQMKDELENLESVLKLKNVYLAVKSDCIVVKGNPQGIKDAEDKIDQMVSNIYKTEHSMNKPGLQDFVDSSQGKTQLKHVNKTAGVFISLGRDGDQSPRQRTRPRSASDADGQDAYTAAGGQKVIVFKGDITGLDVDVIVNAANKDLVHSGGLAKVLINKGGKSIQDECNQHTKASGQLSEGECFCSGAGKMNCKIIVHAVGPVWQGGSAGEENSLCTCVETALEETDGKGLLSLAIPALCTGIFGYPADKATSAIVKTLRDYFSSNVNSTIQTVYLCDVNPAAVNAFQKAANKVFGGGSFQPLAIGGMELDASHANKEPVTIGNIQIEIIKGELSKMKVDVIVNTTAKDLNLKHGAVSASLLSAAGQELQDECSKSYPNGINYGEVAVTSTGKLPCKFVCHGCLVDWKKDGSAIKILESFIKESLSTACDNNCKSVALPAMGTGKLGYPRDKVAKHMYAAIEQFAKQNQGSSVTKVLFVLYHKDVQTVKAFEDEERKRRGSKSGNDHDFSRKPTEYKGRQKKKKQKHDHIPTGGCDKSTEGQGDKPTGGQGDKATGGQGDKKEPEGSEYSVNMGQMVFKVYQGDITAQTVDAIVNGTNPDLDFSMGAVAKAIQKKGGKELEGQLKAQKAEMNKNGIAVTKHTPTGGLFCGSVIHIDMSGVDATKFQEKITKVLQKAEELKVSTVAFPALGTSTNTNIPVSQAAEDMFNTVEKFNSTSTSPLKEIHIVIFQQNMLEDFMKAIKKCVKKDTKKGYVEKLFGWTGLVPGSDDKPMKISRTNRVLNTAQSAVVVQSLPLNFKIYGRDKSSADKAISLLDKMVKDAYIEKPVHARIIKDFTQEQIKEIKKKLTSSGKIEVDIDTTTGEIKLKGMIVHDVSVAVGDANEIISDAEHNRQTKLKVKLVTDMVQWYFIDKDDKVKDKLVEYPGMVNLILESAFKDQKKLAEIQDNSGKKYIVDLDALEEYPANDPKDRVQVLRKSKLENQTFVSPAKWDAMDEKENLKIVQLKPTDQEYIDVTKKFLSTAGTTKIDFVKVERVQNKTLYQQFVAKKKLMDDTNPKTVQNDRELWHGFAVDALNSICSYGFNRSYCGKNATAFGAGVYFAVNVNYSLRDTYSCPDQHGHKRMFLCQVLTGEFCLGNSKMRVPPNKPGAAGSHILYDTVTNTNTNSPDMFIIFHDSQAYPEYMVTFKITP